MTTKNADDQQLSRAYGAVGVCGVILALAALGFFGLRMFASVFAGAVIALFNLWVLSRAVQSLLGGAQFRWAAVAAIKLVVLLGALYFLIDSELVQPLGLAAGFAALPLGIFIAGTLFVPADTSRVKETDHA